MQKNRVQYFRWTPKNARITVMYVAVIPAIMGYIAYKTDVSVGSDAQHYETVAD